MLEKFMNQNILKHAVIQENSMLVEFLLNNGIDVHEENDNAISYASMNGNLEIVKILIRHGANIHVFLEAPLRWAIHNGHLEVVELLLEHDADLHINVNEPILWVIRHGHLHIIKMLIEKQFLKTTDDILFIFNKSCSLGQMEILQYILQLFPEYFDNVVINRNFMTAIRYSDINVAKLLLEYGADVNANNNLAFKTAEENGDAKIIKLLLENGACGNESINAIKLLVGI